MDLSHEWKVITSFYFQKNGYTQFFSFCFISNAWTYVSIRSFLFWYFEPVFMIYDFFLLFYSSLSVSQRILIFLELILFWHGNTFQKYFIIFCNIPSDIRLKIGLVLVTKLKTVILGLLWDMILLHYKLWFPYIFHMLMVYGYAFVRHKITGYI